MQAKSGPGIVPLLRQPIILGEHQSPLPWGITLTSIQPLNCFGHFRIVIEADEYSEFMVSNP